MIIAVSEVVDGLGVRKSRNLGWYLGSVVSVTVNQCRSCQLYKYLAEPAKASRLIDVRHWTSRVGYTSVYSFPQQGWRSMYGVRLASEACARTAEPPFVRSLFEIPLSSEFPSISFPTAALISIIHA